ncbi:MAG: phosphotransferase [Nonomuraea sp.]|nr:phosphotransferase [Nonomuraea sp.]
MREQPGDLDERDLREALKAWDIEETLSYAPLGFGDHHWFAGDWFVTVSERDSRRALETAAALPLGFVVAPVEPVAVPLGRYWVSVFPRVDGEPGAFGGPVPPEVADLLAELHRTTPPPSTPGPSPRVAMPSLDGPWHSEAARDLVLSSAAGLRERYAEFGRRVEELAGRQLVVTHGEPHPGNLLLSGGRYLLVDWDTVRLAVPERDLWWPGTDLDRYQDASGHRPDPGVALYALRWDLADLAEFVTWFREPHEPGQDTDLAWEALNGLVGRLAPS